METASINWAAVILAGVGEGVTLAVLGLLLYMGAPAYRRLKCLMGKHKWVGTRFSKVWIELGKAEVTAFCKICHAWVHDKEMSYDRMEGWRERLEAYTESTRAHRWEGQQAMRDAKQDRNRIIDRSR